jgi:hypothetical protein
MESTIESTDEAAVQMIERMPVFTNQLPVRLRRHLFQEHILYLQMKMKKTTIKELVLEHLK